MYGRRVSASVGPFFLFFYLVLLPSTSNFALPQALTESAKIFSLSLQKNAILLINCCILAFYLRDFNEKTCLVVSFSCFNNTDRVLDVHITLESTDWDTIRFQSRDFSDALPESRHMPRLTILILLC